MKGDARIFLMVGNILFFSASFIFLSADCAVEFIYDGSYCSVDLLITHDLLRYIHDQDVEASFDLKHVFLLAPALTYPSFEKVSLYSSLEAFFRHRDHESGEVITRISEIQELETGYAAMLSFSKKSGDVDLAA